MDHLYSLCKYQNIKGVKADMRFCLDVEDPSEEDPVGLEPYSFEFFRGRIHEDAPPPFLRMAMYFDYLYTNVPEYDKEEISSGKR